MRPPSAPFHPAPPMHLPKSFRLRPAAAAPLALAAAFALTAGLTGCTEEAATGTYVVEQDDEGEADLGDATPSTPSAGYVDVDGATADTPVAANDPPAAPTLPPPAADPAPAAETVAAAGTGARAAADGAAVPVDPNLPTYAKAAGVSGTITSRGSDTMGKLMQLWVEGFQEFYPGVGREIESKGSGSAFPALVEGAALFGTMSRDPKAEESQKFEAEFGYEPTVLPTSIDLVAVYVNKDNPVDTLSLPEVDAIFSKNRNLGAAEDIARWGQVGATGGLGERTVSLYGRNASSGTYGFFKERVLGDGDYKDTVKEQAGSGSVIQGIAGDLTGIGYSGIGYKTSGVKALALAAEQDGEAFEPNLENAMSGEYPLFRFLLLAVNQAPNQPLPPLQREFLKYVFSRQGQEKVVQAGYYPLPADLAKEQLAALGLNE